MSFWHIFRNTLSALIWYQNQIHTPAFLRYDHLFAQDHKQILWKCDFTKLAFKVNYYLMMKWAFKVSYSYNFRFDISRKCINFVRKCLKNQSEINESDRKHFKVCKKEKSQNRWMSYFSLLPMWIIVHISKQAGVICSPFS